MRRSCPNAGIGFLLLAYRDRATLAMNFVVENFLVILLGLVLIEFAALRGEEVLVLLAHVLLIVVRRPFILALIGGMLFTLTGLPSADGVEPLV